MSNVNNGSENVTVEKFGLTVDVAPPSMVQAKVNRRVSKQTYSQHVKGYAKLVKQFEDVADAKSAAVLKAEIDKVASWFAGVGIKPDRGESRSKAQERQRKVTQVSATDHVEQARLRAAVEREDKRNRLRSEGDALLRGNRNTAFGKRAATLMQNKMWVVSDVGSFVSEFAPTMAHGSDRLYLDNAVRDASGYHAIYYRIERIARDGQDDRIVKHWYIFHGDNKGNVICQLSGVSRPEVNSYFYGLVADQIAPNLIASQDGTIQNVGLKTYVHSLLAG